MRNYHAGDLAAAKRDFDNAVDTMLSSGLDLKTSPQLSDEFEHIVDAVNALEMDALKQGNGFAAPMEQTPVGVANDVTFPVDPNIRAAAEAELKTTQSDLPLVINDAVTSYIGYFSNTTTGRNTIVSSLAPRGTLQGPHRAHPARRRRARRSHLSGHRRIRLSGAGRQRAFRCSAACGSSCPFAVPTAWSAMAG